MTAAQLTTAWYRHRWPWFLIALLGTSVCLSLTFVVVAARNADGLVVDNYYEAGRGINRALAREHLAQRLGVRADLRLDTLTGQVDLHLLGDSQPEQLTLNLISPTQPARDRSLLLRRATPEHYVGQLAEPIEGRRLVELLGQQGGQPWRLFEEQTIEGGRAVRLGDALPQAALQ